MTPRRPHRFRFGDDDMLADRLLALVLAGRKTATCSPTRDGRQLWVGERQIVLDAAGRDRALIETTHLYRRRFLHVDAGFALAEGENQSLAGWRADHAAYFARNGGFSPRMFLWCERFRLVAALPFDKSTGAG